jgi:hypothetical protein
MLLLAASLVRSEGERRDAEAGRAICLRRRRRGRERGGTNTSVVPSNKFWENGCQSLKSDRVEESKNDVDTWGAHLCSQL